MKLTHDDQRELTVLTLKGDLIKDEADRFRRATLERLDADIRDFVIDATELESIDSQGLEALLWLQDQAIERLGQVRLAACPDYLHDVLRVTRLRNRLACETDTESAIRSLG
jgi:anti-anti-sigma factor